MVGEIGRDSNIILSEEGAGIEVDSCVGEEVKGHFRELVLLSGRTRDIGIDQCLKLFGSKSRLELERFAHAGLGDGEGTEVGRHCK